VLQRLIVVASLGGGAKGHSDPKAFLMVKICAVIGSISCDGVRAVLEWGLQISKKKLVKKKELFSSIYLIFFFVIYKFLKQKDIVYRRNITFRNR
jgi:hypothetical protein